MWLGVRDVGGGKWESDTGWGWEEVSFFGEIRDVTARKTFFLTPTPARNERKLQSLQAVRHVRNIASNTRGFFSLVFFGFSSSVFDSLESLPSPHLVLIPDGRPHACDRNLKTRQKKRG